MSPLFLGLCLAKGIGTSFLYSLFALLERRALVLSPRCVLPPSSCSQNPTVQVCPSPLGRSLLGDSSGASGPAIPDTEPSGRTRPSLAGMPPCGCIWEDYQPYSVEGPRGGGTQGAVSCCSQLGPGLAGRVLDAQAGVASSRGLLLPALPDGGWPVVFLEFLTIPHNKRLLGPVRMGFFSS